VRNRLCWEELTLYGKQLEADCVSPGNNVRIVMDTRFQYAFLGQMFPDLGAPGTHDCSIWLDSGEERYPAGSPEFCKHVGSMIRQRGMMANLSIRENLLLPFLYGADEEALEEAKGRLEEVAAFLGLEGLDAQAGQRSSFTHALVSLGHCLLKRPDIIVAQEVHLGMSPERLAHFAEKAIQSVERLNAGVLYLTSSPNEGSRMTFARSHEISGEEAPEISGVW